MQQSLLHNLRILQLHKFPIFFIALWCVLYGNADAQSLPEALKLAYKNNPTLQAQRAQLRSTDEQVPIALSGYRPTITVTGEANASYGDISLLSTADELQSLEYSIKLEQPIFRGFRTYNGVKEAEENVKAAQQDLITTEQTVLLNAITAYMDVIRDKAVLSLSQNNINVLKKELQAAKDRFNQGDATKTDVAQARARLSGANSTLSSAKSSLNTSKAVFEQIIGVKPGRLKQPSQPEHLLPKSLSKAIENGLKHSPSILSAVAREKASDFAVEKVLGELLPEITLEAEYGETFFDNSSLQDTETFTVMGRLTMPLYSSGDISARTRKERQNNINLNYRVYESKRLVRSEIIAAWTALEAERARLRTDFETVKANKTALNGVREEQKVGQRTILDVLNAEQELLNSNVNLVRTKRNLIVAAYKVLQTIGKLTVKEMKLTAEIYNPEENYQRVRGKIFGTDIEPQFKSSIYPK